MNDLPQSRVHLLDRCHLKAYTETISRDIYILGKIFSILRSNNLIKTFDDSSMHFRFGFRQRHKSYVEIKIIEEIQFNSDFSCVRILSSKMRTNYYE